MLTSTLELLKKYDKKVWVMINDGGSDKIFTRYFFSGLDSKTICIVSQNKVFLVVASLDKDNLDKIMSSKNNKKIVEYYVYNTKNQLVNILEDIFAKLHFPSEICLSYSTMADSTVDILSHGKYIDFTNLLKQPYKKYSKKVKFTSAENIIYDLISKKTNKQIERLKNQACITNNILKETFKQITVGLTEIQIVDLVNKITDKIMEEVTRKENNEIIYYDMAWENCPIVLTGENLAKGGHSLPSDKKLKYGDTIYFDFGIKIEYSDGEILYTDMQRMGYAKSDDNKPVPKNIQKVFNTLVKAIEDGIDEMKSDVKAYTVDNIVRKKILKAGYPDYNHATGHAVGLNVHDSGAVISLKSCKRATLSLIENGIYTLEPRINIVNGGSIEEMIQVTKYGGIPLCDTQKELYIVK
mgnify:CR=1 FL=1